MAVLVVIVAALWWACRDVMPATWHEAGRIDREEEQ